MPVTVEGLEIACVGDYTEHCFPLGPGPGAIHVTVNGKPVWRVEEDKHVCPQFNGPVPHKGGVVEMGAKKTWVCGYNVARKSDIVVEVPGGDNQIAPGATASKSAAAGDLGGLLKEIPGIPDVLNAIAPDVLSQLDGLLGGELTDILDKLKNLLPNAADSGVLETLKKIWDNREILHEFYGLKDMSLQQLLAWGAGQAMNPELSDKLEKLESTIASIWNLPNDLLGEIAALGGNRVWDAQNKVWVVPDGWLSWLNAKLGFGGITFGNYVFGTTDWKNDPVTFQHELVHTSQSHLLGPAYLPSVIFGYVFGVATAGSTQVLQIHDQNPMEIWADLVSGHPNYSWLGQSLQK